MYKGLLATLLAVATLLAAWQIASYFYPPYILPDVATGIERMLVILKREAFIDGIKASLYRLAVGYPIACLLGAVFGILGGLSRFFAAYLRSLVGIVQAVPPITWVPFMIMIFGFGDIPVISVITIASFFPMALAVLSATEGVNRPHLEVARVMGASRLQLLSKVYAPEVTPSALAGAQIAFGNAWRSLIAAEMVASVSSGLGWSIKYAGELAQMASVMAGIVVVGGLAAVIDKLILGTMKNRLLKWRPAGGEQA